MEARIDTKQLESALAKRFDDTDFDFRIWDPSILEGLGLSSPRMLPEDIAVRVYVNRYAEDGKKYTNQFDVSHEMMHDDPDTVAGFIYWKVEEAWQHLPR